MSLWPYATKVAIVMKLVKFIWFNSENIRPATAMYHRLLKYKKINAKAQTCEQASYHQIDCKKNLLVTTKETKKLI